MDEIRLIGKRIFIVVGLAFMMLLLMSFNNRMADLTRLGSQKDFEKEEVDRLQITKAYLETQVAFAGSDKAVEAWAKDKGGYALGEEVQFFLLTPIGFEALPAQKITPTPQQYQYWEAWREWFFWEW